jgi:hypothetical protein
VLRLTELRDWTVGNDINDVVLGQDCRRRVINGDSDRREIRRNSVSSGRKSNKRDDRER